MHELVALVAPRAILTIANTSIDRLGSEAGYVSMKAATEVYKALGVPDRIGWVQNPTGTHCAFPSALTADVAAFVSKFLGGNASANTEIAKWPYNTNLARWITWTTPTCSKTRDSMTKAERLLAVCVAATGCWAASCGGGSPGTPGAGGTSGGAGITGSAGTGDNGGSDRLRRRRR